MKKHKSPSTEEMQLVLNSMEPVDGEMRTVNQCGDCGKLFGRRFVPYGLGHGLTMGACLCQVTAHRPSKTVMRCEP